MTRLLDQLSDTVYRDKANEIVGQFVSEYGAPITRSQIYGLRQIACQQPHLLKSFADHQRERAEKKLETAGKSSRQNLEAEVAFWKLIADLCEPGRLPWSIATEAEAQMPPELREENIPARADCKSNEERSRRRQLVAQRKQFLERWTAEHVPAFFQRFCTHYLYELAKEEK